MPYSWVLECGGVVVVCDQWQASCFALVLCRSQAPPSCTKESLNPTKKKKEENTDLRTLATWWRRGNGKQKREVSKEQTNLDAVQQEHVNGPPPSFLRHMVLQMFLRSLRLPIFLASRALSARPASNMTIREQPFDYFLVLDFEATCSREKPPPHPQEIIEFPVLKVNGRSFQVESTFHQYVQPRVHRELSSFCTELTGIIQDMVDEQPFLEEVLEKFHQWMCSEGLLGSPEKRAAFVTFGDWDLQKMLPSQCSYFKIPMPEYLTSWINLKK
ncbi:hypothetical protein HPB47_000766, partial [Ixodes persulcatus]